MTKVDIISGFLGAGKTTFIKELISKVFKDEKIVLIENEFGEIGIDSRFMQNAGIEVTEMNSGCICCTLVGDFAKSLKQVVETYAPDRIIIEPSGVGKLSEVVTAVEDVKEEAGIEINSKITVVDGKKARMYMKNFAEFFKNQVEHASTIVISRTQMMKEEDLTKCLEILSARNENATIITTPWDQLDGSVIRSAIDHDRDLAAEMMHEHEHDCCCGHDHEHHHHDEDCDCGCGCEHDHHHEHEHHHHDEHCECGCHDHDHHHEHKHHHHDEDCCCGHDHHEHHHHEHDEHCDCGCHDHDHEHHHHHADEVFTSWGIQTIHKFNRTELEDVLKMLSMSDEFGTVLRAKGIIESEDGQWIEFDMVPEETEIRNCEPDYTGRICVIGTELNTEYLNQVFGK